MKRLFLTAALCAAAAAAFTAATEAQFAGSHQGLLLGWHNLVPQWGASTLVHIGPGGQALVYPTQTSGAWPYWSDHQGMTMEVGNRTVLIPAYRTWQSRDMVLVRWDPLLPGVVGTLWSGPVGRPLKEWMNWTIDADGNPVTIDPSVPELATFDRASGTWRMVALAATPGTGFGGLVWDKANGGFLHGGNGGSGPTIFPELFRTRADGMKTSLVARGSTSMASAWGGDQLGNGDWVSSSMFAPYLTVARGQTTFSAAASVPPLTTENDVTSEKWAVPGHAFFTAQAPIPGNPQGGVFRVDVTGSPAVVTTVWAAPTSLWTSGLFARELVHLYQRDLSTFRTGKATWDVVVNPGRGTHVGRSFLVAASLTAARPPVPLPDGREIYLVPDALTALTVTGAFAPFLTGNAGVVGVQGIGVAKLDFTAVGQAANGLVIHLAAVVFDRSAPNGIGWVTEPWAFVVNVKK